MEDAPEALFIAQKQPKTASVLGQNGGEGFGFGVIELVEEAIELLVREQHYIDTLNPHFNIARIAGSNLGLKFSAETCQRMGDSRRGKKATEIARRNISLGLTGKPKSEQHKARVAISRIGFKHTDAAKAKIGMKHLGQKRAPEVGQRISAALSGKPKSQQHASKISQTRKSRHCSSKLTLLDVLVIRALRDRLSYRQIGTHFGVACSTISNTMNGLTWPLGLHVGLLSEQENTKMLTMLEAIVRHFDIPDSGPEVSVLAEATEPERLVKQIEKVIDKEARSKKMDDGNEP